MSKHIRYVSWGLALALAIAIAPLPYGYYTLLRILAFVGFGFLAYSMYFMNRTALALAFFLLLVLFNPIFLVYLSKETWMLIDGVVAVFLLFFEEIEWLELLGSVHSEHPTLSDWRFTIFMRFDARSDKNRFASTF